MSQIRGSDTTAPGRARVTVNRIESVPEGSRVRHFDELDEPAQDVVADIDHHGVVSEVPGLATGDVIVFTDYFQVE